MYSVHQEATLLESYIESKQVGVDEWQVSDLTESASIDKDGRVHVTICNLDAVEAKNIEGEIIGFIPQMAEGKIVTGELKAHNTFEKPNTVTSKELEVTVTDKGFNVVIPPSSVVRITLA